MRVVAAYARAVAVAFLAFSAGSHAQIATAPKFEGPHPFVVVTFTNEPHQLLAHVGTTGRHYAGDGYSVAQDAHHKAAHIAGRYSLRQVASWPIKALSVHCVVYEIPDNRSATDVVAALTKEPTVTLAQPLQQFHTLTEQQPQDAYNDPLYDLQTNLATLGISAAHEHSQGAGVRVALIDTGVDSKHPDLRNRVAHVQSFVSPRPSSSRSYRHGTAMAGIIAAIANNHIGIVGIAPQARVEVFEACWQLKPDADAAQCNTFTLAQALAAALEAGIPVINLSIAGPADPLLSALVRTGLKRGVIFVGSEGEAADMFPASIEGVISVGSSERGSRTASITAPATHVLTLRPEAQYDFESGTSVAAAEVTGMIALLLAVDDHLTPSTILSLLTGKTGARIADNTPSVTIDLGATLQKLALDQASHRGATASAR